MTPPLDVQSIICQRLIDCNIANGSVFVADQPIKYEPPAVFVADSSTIGNTWEGFWETTLTVSCTATRDYEALSLAHEVRKCLDGWGGNGIEDVTHVSTIPVRTTETSPAHHTRAVSFRVIHLELQ